ncbi:MAG: Dam family site-specific DNA-(adenine-N6)-methyltransferase [Firmicutes bacterium]|nr:Dam family site-specific DNA-(adenine-N6)-methyltransferase [Bacillota bacterium]
MDTLSIKPPLKWAGGKRWLIPHLKPIWEKHRNRRLVEPFCGGLAVTLGLMPGEALVNDINQHLINFFSWLQKGFSIEIELENNEELYYQHRKRFNHLLKHKKGNTKEAAELFYYLNRTGYNGLCRFNKKGFFNVPFGKYKKIKYQRDFTMYKYVFKNWVFSSQDFEELSLKRYDFIYADPPYDVDFTQYAEQGFTWDDQVRLARWLASHPGPSALSNQATPRVVELYLRFGFKLLFFDAPRRISCSGDRTPAKEVLALKNI